MSLGLGLCRAPTLGGDLPGVGNSSAAVGHLPSMSTPSDRELWNRSLAGETTAFGELFERHATPVYNYLFRRCGDWSIAEDLTSIVFLEAWRKRRRVVLLYDSALPWLLRVATNTLRNRRRAERRYRLALERLPLPSETWDPGEEVLERVAGEQRMQEILRLFRGLPEREQDVISLCVWMGLSYEEAAVALGLPVGTVRSRLSRGKGRLRELLEGCGCRAASVVE
jgi:RNA polymerase sigma factor (sigma-70 family)